MYNYESTNNHYKKYKEFLNYCKNHKINIPKIHEKNQYNLNDLILSTMHHVKPLENKFGKNFKKLNKNYLDQFLIKFNMPGFEIITQKNFQD